jgi:hypothetical protein
MREWISVGVWTAAFLLFELPSKDVWGLWPWYSLSETIQVGIAWWWPLAIFTGLFMGVLFGHFEWEWNARWVIAVALLGVALIFSRVIKGI